MATKFLTNLDLNQNQLLKTRFQVLSTDPSSDLFEGWVYYNTTSDTLRIYANGVWRTFLVGISAAGSASTALTVAESGGLVTLTPNLATSSDDGVMSSTDKAKLDNSTSDATASRLVIRDGSGNIKVATPTDDAHAATKAYVDAARSGLDVKASVRVASVAPVAIASALEAGDLIDGITLVAGDRVLLKDQSTASENGIYVAVASGAASRATDADTSAEVTTGMFTFVSEGTVNADNGFVLTTNDTITLGTTGLTFVQFSGAGQITAGDGLTKTGNTINVVGTADRITANGDSVDIASTYVGQSTITTLGTITTGVWGSGATDIAVASGGTGASTAANARTNLGIVTSAGTVTTSTAALARIAKQACAASAAGTSTTTVTHLFNSTDVSVQIYEVSSGATVIGDVVRTNADTVTVTLLGTILAADYTIVVTG